MSVRGLGGKSMHSASAALGAGSKLLWPYACATACSKRRCRDTRCRRVAYHLAWFLRPGSRLCANPCMKPGNAGRSRHKAAPCTRRVDLPLPAGALGSLWCCPADTAAVFVLGVGVCCYRPLPARGKSHIRGSAGRSITPCAASLGPCCLLGLRLMAVGHREH